MFSKSLFLPILLMLLALPQWSHSQDLALEIVTTGVTEPVFATHSSDPTDTRIFILEKGGRIKVVKNGVLLPTPYLDINTLVNTSSEMGLLGLAFDPDFATNGFYYVYFCGNALGDSSTPKASVSRIVCFQQDPQNADGTLANSGTELLSFAQPQDNHDGGWIGFGPNDDYLYIAVGDGGGQGDDDGGHHPTLGNGQSLETVLGKILRIDVNGTQPYTIPASNPFAPDNIIAEGEGEGESVTPLGEIWAYGLRNPWRCSFDSASGDFYIADVGQGAHEEINLQPAASIGGENYGWRLKEGTLCFNPVSSCDPGGLTEPIHDYPRSDGRSVTGGYVYRGSAIPWLQGRYLFGDYATAKIWSLNPSGAKGDIDLVNHTSDIGWSGSLSSFGEDSNGELLLCAFSWGSTSNVYRLIDISAEGEGEGVSEGEGEGEEKESVTPAICGPRDTALHSGSGDLALMLGLITLLVALGIVSSKANNLN